MCYMLGGVLWCLNHRFYMGFDQKVRHGMTIGWKAAKMTDLSTTRKKIVRWSELGAEGNIDQPPHHCSFSQTSSRFRPCHFGRGNPLQSEPERVQILFLPVGVVVVFPCCC